MSALTFADLAASAQEMQHRYWQHETPANPDGLNPYFDAYVLFSEAALLRQPQSLAEIMALAAFAQEAMITHMGRIEKPTRTEAERESDSQYAEYIATALGTIIGALHRVADVPMSAAAASIKYGQRGGQA
jgi:hypothetical protein